MKQMGKLDSRKVLRQIRPYRQQLEVAIQSGNDFEQLHSDIVRLLKITCETKTEYKDVAKYPMPPAVRGIVINLPSNNGQPAKSERLFTFSEGALQQSRKELGTRLLAKLTELHEEYMLRSKLERTVRRTYETDLRNVKNELQNIKSELLGFREEIADIRSRH